MLYTRFDNNSFVSTSAINTPTPSQIIGREKGLLINFGGSHAEARKATPKIKIIAL